MMRDEDKPFVCTRGSVSFNIMPRNATGWIYTVLWLIPAIAMGLGLSWVMEGQTDAPADTALAVGGFIVVMAIWAVAMTRWMYLRSEVIDLRKLTQDKQRRDRGKS